MFNLRKRFSGKDKKKSSKNSKEYGNQESELNNIAENEQESDITEPKQSDNVSIDNQEEEEKKEIKDVFDEVSEKPDDIKKISPSQVMENIKLNPDKKEDVQKIYSDATQLNSDTSSDYMPLESKVEEDIRKIQEAEKKLKELKVDVESLSGQRDYIKTDLNNLQSEIDSAKVELDKLKIEKSERSEELEKLRSAISDAKDEVDKLQSQRTESNNELEKIHSSINQAKSELDRLQSQRTESNNELQKLQSEINITKSELNSIKREQESVKNQIVSARSELKKLVQKKEISNSELEELQSKASKENVSVQPEIPSKATVSDSRSPYELIFIIEQLRSMVQKTEAENKLLSYKVESILEEIKNVKTMFSLNAQYGNMANIQATQQAPKPATEQTQKEEKTDEESDVTSDPDEIKMGLANLIKSAKAQIDDESDSYNFEELEEKPVEYSPPEKTKSKKDPKEILEAASKVVASLNAKLRMKQREFERTKHSLEGEIGITKRMLEKERLEHKKTKEKLKSQKKEETEEINQ